MNPTTKIFFSISLACSLLLCSQTLKAQAPKSSGDTVELTETDFAKLSSFNGSHATLFGIALGMGRGQAMAKIKNYQYLTLKADPFNPRRFYIEDLSSDTGKVTIAYLKWPNYDSGLYQIVIYPAMAKYFKGLSASIVSPDCVDSSSVLYKSFLGAPSSSPVTVDIPAIKSKTIMLYYPKYNIVIEEDQNADKTIFELVLTHKWKR